MKYLVVLAIFLIGLSGCKEEQAKPAATNSGTGSSETSGSATGKEDTATTDDGGGAMEGATSDTEQAAAQPGAPANISEVSQDAIDGCIDGLRAVEGAVGGTVVSTEFSEANSLVMLQDGNGATWRCVVGNDGKNPFVESTGGESAPATEDTATADDGGGAMDGAEDTATADDGDGAMDGAESTSNSGEALPSVGSPTDISAFIGAPAGQAPGGLKVLGFEAIRTEGLTTFWFNRDTGACARIRTAEGVFAEVEMLTAEDC